MDPYETIIDIWLLEDRNMPKKQRHLATDSAILAKLLSGSVRIVDELSFDAPKTKEFVSIMGNLEINRSCLVATSDYNDNLYKSARNIPKVAVLPISDLNAGDICNRQKMLITKDAFLTLINKEVTKN